eukprot:TRINITY_DN17514_c0_g1_i1.p1 TRINITY_DN17514_c0_g1~~TRINITY_DN17514_c0_g1_i1.p1  ORF type:complete len:141 (-),score=25.14 TRINITY_DN17514_c0_g1_i1:14-436(-)
MASMEDLKQALRDNLDQRGVLDSMRAQIRSEIFNSLDEQDTKRPALSHEVVLLNELVLEYLNFVGYNHTSSVMRPESGQPIAAISREDIADELNLPSEVSRQNVPLLFSALQMLRTQPDTIPYKSKPQGSGKPGVISISR